MNKSVLLSSFPRPLCIARLLLLSPMEKLFSRSPSSSSSRHKRRTRQKRERRRSKKIPIAPREEEEEDLSAFDVSSSSSSSLRLRRRQQEAQKIVPVFSPRLRSLICMPTSLLGMERRRLV